LAPLAVLPDFQNQGIGSALVQASLTQLKRQDISLVIVLGHPCYYIQFGFEPAAKYQIKPAWEGIPQEVFMVLII